MCLLYRLFIVIGRRSKRRINKFGQTLETLWPLIQWEMVKCKKWDTGFKDVQLVQLGAKKTQWVMLAGNSTGQSLRVTTTDAAKSLGPSANPASYLRELKSRGADTWTQASPYNESAMELTTDAKSHHRAQKRTWIQNLAVNKWNPSLAIQRTWLHPPHVSKA